VDAAGPIVGEDIVDNAFAAVTVATDGQWRVLAAQVCVPLTAVSSVFTLDGISEDERTLVGSEGGVPEQYRCA
jgi:hypothetical protein